MENESDVDRIAQERLERLLLEGSESGDPIQLTPEFWERKKQELITRAEQTKPR